jgi:hypothetical protein
MVGLAMSTKQVSMDHDQSTNASGFPNIYLVQSTNAGTDWDPPLFMAWYDRREDTASNSLIQIWGAFGNVPITTNSFTNNFLISTARFPPIHSGTNTNANTFDPVYPPIFDEGDPRFCGSFEGNYRVHMGDYDTAVSDNRYVYYSWFDGRNTCTNGGVIRQQADIRSIRLSWP